MTAFVDFTSATSLNFSVKFGAFPVMSSPGPFNKGPGQCVRAQSTGHGQSDLQGCSFGKYIFISTEKNTVKNINGPLCLRSAL